MHLGDLMRICWHVTMTLPRWTTCFVSSETVLWESYIHIGIQDQTSCILYLARSRLARSRLAQTLSVTAVWTCRCSPLGTTTLYGPSHSFRTLTSSTNRSKQEYKQQLRHNCLSDALHPASKAEQFGIAALAGRWRKNKLRLPGTTSLVCRMHWHTL